MKMKAKSMFLFGITALVMILLTSFASAAIAFNPSSLSDSGDQGTTASINFVMNNTATATINNIQVYKQDLTSGSNTISASDLTLIGVPSSLAGYANASVTLDITISGSQATGTYTGNLIFEGNYTNLSNYTLPVSLTVTSNTTQTQVCNYSNPGDLKISIENINNKGIGSDDEWYPVDKLDITIELENEGDEDVDDVLVEWAVYSEEANEWIIEWTEADEFNLNDDEKEEFEFEIDIEDDIEVDMDDLKDGNHVLYVRAEGEIDDGSNTKTCISDSENIDMMIEDDYVVLTDLKVTGTTYCGNTVQITANIWNIGDDDQDDVQILIYNSDLNIDETAKVGDIDAFEDKKLDFEFTIPTNAEEKKYDIQLEVLDEDGDIYENSDDDESKYAVRVEVGGNCEQIPDAVVYASLESGGKVGQEMEIKATVTNTGDSRDTFTIDVADYASWAELKDISPASVTLDPDEEQDVIITFKVDKDAEEDQNFNIVLTSNDGDTTTQPVAVTIEQGFTLSGLVGENPYLWGIAVASVVLVILIVIVAVRASRR